MSFKMIKGPFLFLLTMTIVMGCDRPYKSAGGVPAADIDTVVRSMSDIMVHDVTNPPLAARFFAYAFLAGYEVVSQNNPSFKSMKGVLNDYPAIDKPAIEKYDYRLAALLATIGVATSMQPSGNRLEQLKQKLMHRARQDLDGATVDGSVNYASAIVAGIMKYARADGYRSFSDYPRYTPVEGDGYWFPTPPGYIAAVEPYFSKLRPFFLDSCTQFASAPPVPFDKNKSSAFHALMDSVYRAGEHLNKEQQEIAAFWDCNPFALNDRGHLKVGIKKISPGAHWMGIAGIACTQQGLSFDSSMMVHSLLAMTLTDAFICCWHEKYHSNRIRPETAIRRYIDPQWKPFLQTPPFPEYLSGHSVVSAASAELLSHFFGEGFAYKDSVEQDFGLMPRNFRSFREAAREAAVSRFYGGIHFTDAIENGLIQGEKVGKQVLKAFKEK
jgi:hypothetical protein